MHEVSVQRARTAAGRPNAAIVDWQCVFQATNAEEVNNQTITTMEREDSICPICGGRIWENESADFCMDCGEVFPKSKQQSHY